ncbi:hypothetical protein BD408DRAFT_422483 [Parasitella parasitica]|nr:hypothetical protein BD408DRAFT_422483 [Parasitella parasitica]
MVPFQALVCGTTCYFDIICQFLSLLYLFIFVVIASIVRKMTIFYDGNLVLFTSNSTQVKKFLFINHSCKNSSKQLST